MSGLYEKTVTPGGKVKYVPYTDPVILVDDVEQEDMVTLLSSLAISMLITVEKQLPPHARLAREIRNVEQAIQRLAQLNAVPLSEELVEVGVAAWNGALRTIQHRLSGGVGTA